ncbi:MAG: hypothetical protein WB643_12420 [Candidatus Bathyarchaeia archaeon]
MAVDVIDEYGLQQTFRDITGSYAANCLKPISDTLDTLVIAGVQQALRGQIASFLASFENERASVSKVLSGKKIYQRFSKPPATFDERYERIAFILPNEKETRTIETQKGTLRSWLIASLLMKSEFIVEYSNRLLQEIDEISQNTFQIHNDEFIEFSKTFDSLRLLEDMQRVLYESVAEYIDIKGHLYSELGLFSDYRPMVKFPNHWLEEMDNIRVDFARGDESAIYHARTTIELMLQLALKYFDDPMVEKSAKRITIRRVMDACRDLDIRIPLSKNLVDRVVFHSNMSLHRGRRVSFSDIWYVNESLRIISPQMEGVKFNDAVLKELKEELIGEKDVLSKIAQKCSIFLSRVKSAFQY